MTPFRPWRNVERSSSTSTPHACINAHGYESSLPVEECPCQVVHGVLLVLNGAGHNLCTTAQRKQTQLLLRVTLATAFLIMCKGASTAVEQTVVIARPRPINICPSPTPCCAVGPSPPKSTATTRLQLGGPASKAPPLCRVSCFTCVECVVQEVVQVALNGQRLKQELLVVLLAGSSTHQHTLANLGGRGEGS